MPPRVRSRMSLVLVSSLLSGVMVSGAACSQPTPPPSVSMLVHADAGGRVDLGSAGIEIPAGVLDHDATVSITREARPLELVSSGAPDDVFQFSTGGVGFQGKVRLYLPMGKADVDANTNAMVYRSEDGSWNALPAQAKDGHLTAEVDHLSLWDGFNLGAWLVGRKDIFADIVKFLGLRAKAPVCASGGGGRVTLDYRSGDLAQPPVLACVEQRSTGDAMLKMVNNRSYAMAFDASALTSQPVRSLDSGAVEHSIAVLGTSGDRVVVPPGGEADFLLSSTGDAGSVTYQPDVQATLAMASVGVLSGLVSKEFAVGKAIALTNCARGVTRSTSLDDVNRAITKCTYSVLKGDLNLSKLAGTFKVAGELAEAAALYVVTSMSVGIKVLDAWADLALFNAAVDKLSLQRVPDPASRTNGAQPPVPAPGLSSATAAPAPPLVTPPAQPVPVVHYNVPNDRPGDNSNRGHYLSPGKYWQEEFSAQGSTIAGGWILVGANSDGGDHRATIGIYGSQGLSEPLGQVIVPVGGYSGQSFTFPAPIRVATGQQLYLTVVGVGDLTVYGNAAGDDIIGRVDGFR